MIAKGSLKNHWNEARAILAGPDRLNPDEGAGALTGTDMPDD